MSVFIIGLPINFKLENIIQILKPGSYEQVTIGAAKKPLKTCTVHTNKTTDYYCTSCNSLACGDCLLEKHLSHDGVKRLTEIVEECAQALKELIPDVHEALARGEVSLNEMQNHSESLVQQGKEVTQGIEAYFEKLRDLLMKRELELKKEVTEQVGAGGAQIKSNSLTLKKAMEEMKNIAQNSELAIESKSPELLLKQEQLKSDFESSQKQLDGFCKTASELQKFSVVSVPLEDPRLEVLCQKLGAKVPTPRPRKRHGSLPSSSELNSKVHTLLPPKIQVEEALDEQQGFSENDAPLTRSRSYSFINTPNTECWHEIQDKNESSTDNDAPPPSPSAPMNSSVVIEPDLIWGMKQLSNDFFQNAQGSVYPRGVCCGVSGTLVVTDVQNHCIRIIASIGKCIGVIGREGKGDGQFGEPTAVTTDLDGNMLVCNLLPPRLQKFSADGKCAFAHTYKLCIVVVYKHCI